MLTIGPNCLLFVNQKNEYFQELRIESSNNTWILEKYDCFPKDRLKSDLKSKERQINGVLNVDLISKENNQTVIVFYRKGYQVEYCTYTRNNRYEVSVVITKQ